MSINEILKIANRKVAAKEMREFIASTPLSFSELMRCRAIFCKEQDHRVTGQASDILKIALIGEGTLNLLQQCMTTHLNIAEIDHSIHVGQYNSFRQEILGPDGFLQQEKFDVIVICPASQLLKRLPLNCDDSMLSKHAESIVEDLTDFGGKAKKLAASVFVLNFPVPGDYYPGFNRFQFRGSEQSLFRYCNELLNTKLRARRINVIDVEYLSSVFGSSNAFSLKGWIESKLPWTPDFTALIARDLAFGIVALNESAKKVLVIDLDNTIWGGAIGDDGVEGIELGGTSGKGEAYQYLQQVILRFKDQGMLLAVASKNHEASAKEAFSDHPEMILNLSDFVSFQANWQPKADNIRRIAQETNLSLDHFVFLDDNPVELASVEAELPEVSLIRADDDPCLTVKSLLNSSILFPNQLTDADAVKTTQYLVEAARTKTQSLYSNQHDFLKSLQMIASVSPFNSMDLPRVSQLIVKSNQFNLTTRRRTFAEVEALGMDEAYRCFSVRLRDKFGDYGLVVVVIGKIVDVNILVVDSWLMSCRVMSRNVEKYTLSVLAEVAISSGCTILEGHYIPTAKNKIVANLYEKLGFSRIATGTNCSEQKFQIKVEDIKDSFDEFQREGSPDASRRNCKKAS